MVSTGGPSAGGSGFEYGENTVAARLSIDIPTEGVQSLREITQEIARFRTEMEAAARSEGDFISFFQTLPSIAAQASSAYKTFADQLERSLALQERMQGAVGQWDVQPGSTPDNFKGMSVGMGRSPQDINQTVADMDRMREMGTVGQRQFLNVHSQHGAIGAGDMPISNSDNDIAAAAQRISDRERVNMERITGDPTGVGRGGGIAREIMNEFSVGSGGSPGGMMTQMMRRGITAAAGSVAEANRQASSGGNQKNHQSAAVPTPESGTSGSVGDEQGGMNHAGTIMSLIGRGLGFVPGLGPVGAALGVAGMGLTGFQLAQTLGPKVQNLKDQGLVQGGGVKEGLEQEIQARMMAINPFITNDQARSIVQSALRDGYSGKEYETVTKFMQDNLKDFAISVQDSRDMVKKQMVQGGATPEAIAATMEQQKALSKGSYISFEDRKNVMNSLVNRATDMGVSYEVATKSVGAGIEMFGDSQLTKGLASDLDATMLSDDLGTQAMLLQMAGISPSADWSEWPDQLMSGGEEAKKKIFKALVRISPHVGAFRMALKNYLGIEWTIPQARKIYNDIKSGKDMSGSPRDKLASTVESVQEQSAGERFNAGIGGAISAVGGSIADAVTGNFSNIPGRFRGAEFSQQNETIPILEKIVGGGDPNRILVQDASGEWQKLQPNNSDQLKQLAAGGKWKRADDQQSSGYTLQQAAADNTTFGTRQNVEVQGAVQINISTDPGVKVSGGNTRTVTLTQNQVRSNAGYGNHTMNNAPPGDR